MANISMPAFLCLFIISAGIVFPHAANGLPPTVFMLGDSLLDVGTNTYMPQSRARADFPHNGIDFPFSKPTGRFSNGLNTADFIAKSFGINRSPPPFLFLLTQKSVFQKSLSNGVNFASGGAGLLDVTSSYLNAVALSEQINQFSTVKDNLTALIGSPATQELISKSLFFISIGGNDIFGYFRTNSKAPKEQFIGNLISVYANHITNLYKLGARKFGILGVASLGCVPSQRLVQKLVNGVDGCFEPANDFATTFHSSLEGILVNMTSQLPGFKYSLGNGYSLTTDFTSNPQKYNFETVDSACCGTGALNGGGPCNQTASLCMNRQKYLFWDFVHPTERTASIAANTFYSGPPDYVSPFNFAQLALE